MPVKVHKASDYLKTPEDIAGEAIDRCCRLPTCGKWAIRKFFRWRAESSHGGRRDILLSQALMLDTRWQTFRPSHEGRVLYL